MNDFIDETCSKIRFLLEEAVERNFTDSILLSGGLDTSILAVIASKSVSLRAFTVAFEGGPAPDTRYAILVAKKLGLKHIVHHFDEEELYDAIPLVVKKMRSFDPMEIRNSVSICIGLRVAKENGIYTIMTGDGSDELFAGYNFLLGLERKKLDLELQKLWSVMRFSSVPLANALGMEAKLSYLDPEFKAFAMKINLKYKVRTENGRVYGKWVLRKAFENVLPRRVVWRVKVPIEYGSGTTILPRFFNKKISDVEFDEKRRIYLDEDKVTIRDKEHLFYYEIYRSVIGVPHPTDPKGKMCPQCNSSVPENASYCRTCGAYPI